MEVYHRRIWFASLLSMSPFNPSVPCMSRGPEASHGKILDFENGRPKNRRRATPCADFSAQAPRFYAFSASQEVTRLIIIMVFITTPPRRHRQSSLWRGHLLPSPPRRPQTHGPRSPLRGVTIRQDGGGPVRQEPVRPWGRRPKAKPGGGQRVRANPGEQVS